MKLLLDTHILLWWLRGNAKLGAQTRRVIADPRAEPVVSIASFWEVSIKARTGKLAEFGALLMAEATAQGFGILQVQPRHLAVLEGLAKIPGHNDPFDHLIVAQAKAENAMLITGDKQLRSYGIDCFPS